MNIDLKKFQYRQETNKYLDTLFNYFSPTMIMPTRFLIEIPLLLNKYYTLKVSNTIILFRVAISGAT